MISGTRIDYWRNSLIKRTFIGGWESTVSGGNPMNVELWNPAASGKLLICNRVNVWCSGASKLRISHHNAAYANSGSQGNKYLGQAAGVGLIKYAGAALPATPIADNYIPATVNIPIEFVEPFIIPAGIGLVFSCVTTDLSLSVLFQWIEVNG